ncbi:hypothetical protein Nmel_018393 [Mimus melanotis]
MAQEDVLLRQCVGVAVVQAFGPELQAALQLAVGPGKRVGTPAWDGTLEAQTPDQHCPSGLPSPCTLLLEGKVLLFHTC